MEEKEVKMPTLTLDPLGESAAVEEPKIKPVEEALPESDLEESPPDTDLRYEALAG